MSRLSDNRCALRKGTSRHFPRNVVKLLTFNGDCGSKQKAANRSMNGVGGRQAPDQTKLLLLLEHTDIVIKKVLPKFYLTYS